MVEDTANYEKIEEIAISDGKAALSTAPWLFNRRAGRGGGFVELRENDRVHPNHYSAHCVDGVGSKLFLGPWSGFYGTFMQDGIGMVANDLAPLLNAYLDTVDVYLACQKGIEEKHM